MGALLVFGAVHVLIPLLLLAWQWRSPVASRSQWVARTVAFGTCLLALFLAGFWIVLPRALAGLYLALFAAASIASWTRMRPLQWAAPRTRSRVDVLFHAGSAVVFLCAATYAALGHLPPDRETVELTFPLRGGEFAIASAGSNRLMNFHLETLDDPRLAAWRGQSYAVDIVELNDFGTRASGFAPGDPQAYVIFGRPVVAPCGGQVVESRDGLPDQPPPRRDPQALPGNFVLLVCGRFEVLLAHFKNGSVSVKRGQTVAAGQPVGRVGNSGNTTEPHLHIHAQLPGAGRGAMDGEPLAITFGGSYLARNDRVSN
jgi:hypothetical protein